MTVRDGDFYTAERVRRLSIVLRAINSFPPPGIAEERADRVLWANSGGPVDEVRRLVDVLSRLGLVEVRAGHIRVSREGRRIATQDHQAGGRLLVQVLIDRGEFAGQAHRLLALSDIDMSGNLTCRRSSAVRSAAQLVGALRRLQAVEFHDLLVVPSGVVTALVDSLEFAPDDSLDDSDPRKAIGNRAEAYSNRVERESSGDPNAVRWVALDNETLGYDIVIESEPKRLVEVKGSTKDGVQFYVSRNEYEVAHRWAAQYEIHFWGGIDLRRSRRVEYSELRVAGYPKVFKNVAAMLESGELIAEPHVFRVHLAEPTPQATSVHVRVVAEG